MEENDYSFKTLQQEEINIKNLINVFFRNKKIIGLMSFVFFIFGFVISSTMKTIWQGEFQIVLNSDLDKTLDNITINYSGGGNFGGGGGRGGCHRRG